VLRATQHRVTRQPLSNLYENVQTIKNAEEVGEHQPPHHAGPAQRKSRGFLKSKKYDLIDSPPTASLSSATNQNYENVEMENIYEDTVVEEQEPQQIYENI